jgi:hypothetical protein
VTSADVPAQYLDQLNSGVEESSVAAARSYVTNLVATRACQLNPTGPLCTPSTGSTTPVPSTTATTVPATTTTKAP